MTTSAARPISTILDLRDHLQSAIALEWTTIPPYLCALYTIEDGANPGAADVIQSVVMEEMLHMALAANVLNAIGGVPAPDTPPVYPARVPFISRMPEIHLAPFSPEAVDTFLAIEYPDEPGEPDGDRYDSIGGFYKAITTAIERICTPEVFAEGARARPGCQLTPAHYYGGAGKLIEVVDQATALAALDQIVREGEGVAASVLKQTALEHRRSASPLRIEELSFDVEDLDTVAFGWKMYSHYARFREIRCGRTYLPDQLVEQEPEGDLLPIDWGAVLPMVVDPTAAAFEGTPVHSALVACNASYTEVIECVYRSFDGHPEALLRAVHAMYELKYQATALMKTPSPYDPNRTLGPPFEFMGDQAD